MDSFRSTKSYFNEKNSNFKKYFNKKYPHIKNMKTVEVLWLH